MVSTVTSIVKRHVLPKFGHTRLVDLDKLELQKHLNALAESFSRSLVKKILVLYRAILEEAVERDLVVKNQARKLAMPPTRKACGRFLALEEFDALVVNWNSGTVSSCGCSARWGSGRARCSRCGGTISKSGERG